MKLTCVTAVFNAINVGNRERLIRCIESVAKLKTEHEHLIYDAASTDGTVELLRELEAKTPGLKVVSEPDTGIYNALNKGVRDAKGEWFYVLGCDDYIESPFVMDQLVADSADDVECLVSTVNRDGVPYQFANLFELRHIFQWIPYCHQGVLVRVATMRRLKGFDESYRICADCDFFIRAHKAQCRFCYKYRPFACFSAGGVNETNRPATNAEYQRMIATQFGVSDSDMKIYARTLTLPFRVVLPYMFSRDLALLIGAWYMVYFRIRRKTFDMIKNVCAYRRGMKPAVCILF